MMAHRGSTARGMDIVLEGAVMTKKREVRIAGFDCAEEKHRVVLLDAKGKVEKELDITKLGWPVPQPRFTRRPSASRVMRLPFGKMI